MRDDDLRDALEMEARRVRVPGREALGRLLVDTPSRRKALAWPNIVRQIVVVSVGVAAVVGGMLLLAESPRFAQTTPPQDQSGQAEPPQKGKPKVVAEEPSATVSVHRSEKGLPVWADDGTRLLYLLPDRRLGLLSLGVPGHSGFGEAPVTDGIFGPEDDVVIYVGPRNTSEQEQRPMTLYLQSNAGDPIELLEGEVAVHGTSTVKYIHRWVAPSVLAFEEHVGTGASELVFVDIDRRSVLQTPRLAATYFNWSPDGTRVAGQWYGGPPHFWLWDWSTMQTIVTPELPGQYQHFEAWSNDGQSLLFTAWEGGWPYSGGRPSLYRLDLQQGRLQLVAEDGALASWSGDHLAFVEVGKELSLVVMDASASREVWRENLGPTVQVTEGEWEELRPHFAASYLSYRTVEDDYWVSPVAQKQPRWVYSGVRASLTWSPDASYVAILSDEQSPHLQVIQNPHLAP